MSRIEEALAKAAALRKSPEQDRKPVEAPPVRPIRPVPPQEVKPVEIDNPLLVTVTDPFSPGAEEYRKLKTMLVSLLKGDKFRNTIMITSAVSGEGKTLTSINLALTLAQEFDHTVLLVDADLRKPSVAEYLGVKTDRGLSDCILNRVDVGDVLVKTGIEGLTLLPAGTIADNPAELFTSRVMADLILQIRNRYSDRFIIFDAPPILPFAETRSLAHIVDATLFVVKEGAASKRQVEEAIHALRGTSVAGIVYNHATGAAITERHYYRDYRYQRGPAANAADEKADVSLVKRMLAKFKR